MFFQHLVSPPSFLEDSEILKNYRPVANLSFISKIIENAIATQIHDHLIDNDIVENFQSAYKAGHSCETIMFMLTTLNYISHSNVNNH